MRWVRFLIVFRVVGRSDSVNERDEADGGGLRSAAGISQDDLAARCALQGFDIGLRGVSDLEMVLLAKALRVKLDELVPGKLPAWEKDLRPPTARAGDGE